MTDELSQLAIKYGADKCPQIKHGYTPFYDRLLNKKRFEIKKILEIGAGDGASLRMWQDYFPNAKIFAAEIDPKRVFKAGRIEVIKCNQSSKKDLLDLIYQTGSDLDLVIDDGSHLPDDQVFTCLNLMPVLKADVEYIIEDVADESIVGRLKSYQLEVPEIIHTKRKYDDRLIVVRNKPDTFEYIKNKFKLNTSSRQVAIEIPNTGRNNLAELFAELGFKKGAEIGVSVGHFSEILCQANPDLELFCVDPWQLSSYGQVNPQEVGILGTQAGFESEYQEAKKRLSNYNCQIIRKTSLQAAEDFADSSLDFVYIDANHDFVNVAIDIDAWKKKVKPGGILSGHDYAYFYPQKRNHVKYVVDSYMAAYQMVPYFILGAKTPQDRKEVRDRVRSWFWVKK